MTNNEKVEIAAGVLTVVVAIGLLLFGAHLVFFGKDRIDTILGLLVVTWVDVQCLSRRVERIAKR